MKIPWSLVGTLVHNCVTALCISPSMHRDLSIRERCEASISGFILADLFRLLGDSKCRSLKLPKGSCQMAAQTIFNMQGVALCTATICVSKPTGWMPWSQGHHRLAEVTIEEYFGALRSQQSNAQMSARQYFQATGRYMLKNNDRLNKGQKRQKQSSEKALTDSQLLAKSACFIMFF